MRVKLTAKHPRPASPSRAPVRPSSPSARKATRPAPAERPAPAKKATAPRAAGQAAAYKKDGSAAKTRDGAAARVRGERRTEKSPGGARTDRRTDDAPRGAPRTRTTTERRTEDAPRGAPRTRATDRRAEDTPRGAPRAAERLRGADRPSAGTARPSRGDSGERYSRGDRPARNTERSTPLRTAKPVKAATTGSAGGSARPNRSASAGSEDGLVRLSKRMSELGLCSRREADEWIENGWVRVDGERIDTLGTRIRPDQKIEVTRDAQAAQSRQVTILLHKPVGYVSGQAEDGYEPAVTLITAANRWEGDRATTRFVPSHLRALAPAGRLDIDSTGLLVLTQDGRIAKQLIGEHSSVEKEYLVRVTYGEYTTDVAERFPAEKLALLRFGLSLDGVALKAAKVSWQNGEQLRFVLREGKKRQIRRMCELVGLQVVGLKRVRMGSVALGALPQGKWRYLLPNEAF